MTRGAAVRGGARRLVVPDAAKTREGDSAPVPAPSARTVRLSGPSILKTYPCILVDAKNLLSSPFFGSGIERKRACVGQCSPSPSMSESGSHHRGTECESVTQSCVLATSQRNRVNTATQTEGLNARAGAPGPECDVLCACVKFVWYCRNVPQLPPSRSRPHRRRGAASITAASARPRSYGSAET